MNVEEKKKRRSRKYEKSAFDKAGVAPPATDPYEVMHLDADDEARFLRAQRAVRKFRQQIPSLTGYVRAITKNPRTQIVLYAGPPATDGDNIFMQPPIALGDELKHDKRFCHQRDDYEIPICEACRNNEDAGLSIRHECAHIIFNSFDKVEEKDKLGLLDLALKEWGAEKDGTRAAKLKKRLEKFQSEAKRRGKDFSYVHANNCISPFLPMIFNGLEDARVNIAMYNARPGTYKMFKAHAANIFMRGVEQMDGNWMAWRDQPLDAQAVVALYSKCIGFPYEGFFSDEVCDALKAPEFDKLANKVRTARNARQIYKLGFSFLEELRKHGFCKLPDDLEDEEEGGAGESGEGDESGEGESSEPSGGGEGEYAEADAKMAGKSGQKESDEQESDDSDESGNSSSSDQGDDEADSAGSGGDDEGEDEGDGDSDGEDADEDHDGHGSPEDVARAMKAISGHDDFGGGWGSADDGEEQAAPTEDQLEVSRAVNQEEHFDEPSQAIYGVAEWKNGDRSAPGWGDDRYGDYWGETEKAGEAVMAPALMKMRVVFSDNRKKRKHPNLKKGRISTRNLRRVLTDDPRIFQKKTEPGERDYFVVIGLDISGSTSTGAIRLMKSSGLAQAELLSRAGLKFAVYAHTGTRRATRKGSSMANLYADIHVIKGPRDLWDNAARERLENLHPASANLDGHTLEYYRKVAEREKATEKLIMYYTDGAMPAENYNEELGVLQREIRNMPKRQITVVGVGIRTDAPIQHGLDTIRIDSLEDVPLVVDELKKRLTTHEEKRTLAS